METVLRLPWQVPFGEFSLRIDPLSLIFLTAIAILVICAGVYGVGYMQEYKGRRSLGFHVFFYVLLAIAMFLVVTANNAILFLGAWETMSIATYFLIIFHDEKASVRQAGFLYLIATHCGTFLLILMFFLLSFSSGSMSFDVIAQTTLSPVLAGGVFLLAVMGFGVKAGFLPVHIWLPHAHPAAPSHVSALLSGVAIKTGIYGICRVLWMVSPLPDWCGYVMLFIGIISGLMGVLYALGQHELKKLLAYHSIENIGIIALGLGIGLIGFNQNQPIIATLGAGGALLHVLNHSLFKGLLFLSAGAVIKKTHTGHMDHLGGLSKSMPLTAALFLIGALSICGLPLFNGFISEFLIFSGLFQGLLQLKLLGVIACAAGILALALMGALALACFTKVYGTVFSGEPRTARPSSGKEMSSLMALPMIALAALCFWIGTSPFVVTRMSFGAGEYLLGTHAAAASFERVAAPLSMIVGASFLLICLILILMLLRRYLLGALPMPRTETWSCGFSQWSGRMQYTSSSFARSILECFKKVLQFGQHGGAVTGEFSATIHMASHIHDISEESALRPALAGLRALSKKIDERRIRYTRTYLMYIFVFLIALLIWKLR